MQVLGPLSPEIDTVALARAPGSSSSDCDDLKRHCLAWPLGLSQGQTLTVRAFRADRPGKEHAGQRGRGRRGTTFIVLVAGGGEIRRSAREQRRDAARCVPSKGRRRRPNTARTAGPSGPHAGAERVARRASCWESLSELGPGPRGAPLTPPPGFLSISE